MSSTENKTLLILVAATVILLVFTWLARLGIFQTWQVDFVDRVSNFSVVFLGIFIEAAPFLLLGTLASGFVEIFISRQAMARIIPRNRTLAALSGGFMGLLFPVCECGVVPLTRRLFGKGLPPAMGISFLLAAPVINPIVIASTYAAFGFSPIFWGRIILSFSIAVLTGLIFSLQTDTDKLFIQPPDRSTADVCQPGNPVQKKTLSNRLRQVLVVAIDELFEMGRYLILGALLAALMQSVLPQTVFLAVGQSPLLSVFSMITLAFILSICSTVDAFIALAFTGTFTTGSILAFLVYGPMVDIKSTLMYLRVFKRKYVLYLVLLPLLMVVLMALIINYFWISL